RATRTTKKVTFVDDGTEDKENVITTRRQASTGLKAKPVRKPSTRKATKTTRDDESTFLIEGSRPKTTPLSPKKPSQLAVMECKAADENDEGDAAPFVPSLSKSPVKSPMKSPFKISTASPLKVTVAESQLNASPKRLPLLSSSRIPVRSPPVLGSLQKSTVLAPHQNDSPIRNVRATPSKLLQESAIRIASPIRQSPTMTSVGQSMRTADRGLRASPSKIPLPSPPTVFGTSRNLFSSHIGGTQEATKQLQASPSKMLFKPSSVISQSPMKSSFLQSPARRPAVRHYLSPTISSVQKLRPSHSPTTSSSVSKPLPRDITPRPALVRAPSPAPYSSPSLVELAIGTEAQHPQRDESTINPSTIEKNAVQSPQRQANRTRSISDLTPINASSPRRASTRSRSQTVISYSPTTSPNDAPLSRNSTISSPSADLSTTPRTPSTPAIDASPRSTCLAGAIVYVEVFTLDGDDFSAMYRDILHDCGARCVRQFVWDATHGVGVPCTIEAEREGRQSASVEVPTALDGTTTAFVGVTHVVFKDGAQRTLEKVAASDGAINCVNANWATDCEKSATHLPEAEYAIPLPPSSPPTAAPPSPMSEFIIPLSPTTTTTTNDAPTTPTTPTLPPFPSSTTTTPAHTPYYLHPTLLLQRTCLPPSSRRRRERQRFARRSLAGVGTGRVGRELFRADEGDDGSEEEEEEGVDKEVRRRLMYARRQSLRWVPRTRSPLGRWGDGV
ncbi:MAG: hypothetical protein M1833_006014, partial [Piccolia ochrophora]